MYNSNQNEQEILKYWQDHKCFEKSVSERPEDKPYVFYDGPPFATGLPHYGHILSSVIKDVVPRYWTMKGYRVRRHWGWDCHGMPIENIIEKELKVSGKNSIESNLGVEKFNDACRSKVLVYTKEWKKMVDRIGRWIEFDNAYKTMDPTYMESVWWSLKTMWDKNLIYEGRKVLMYCPRCETPVSKAEIAMDNSYKDVTEESVTAKFKVIDPKKHNLPENTYILAWTTTPWTLPGNVVLAVGKNIGYSLLIIDGANYILATERVAAVLAIKQYKILKELKGADLVGIEYEPLFAVEAVKNDGRKCWYVTSADFVTTEEGTGVVHTAVIYGEDDYNLGVKINLPMVPLLDEKGMFNSDAPELVKGVYFKEAEKAIKRDLEERGVLFSRAQNTHSYPFCWRCDTQLFYNAISAWFINIQKIKPRLIELNEKINWFPDHLKHGRFLNILETAPDWNISRNRYWATPLPFWKCECGEQVCVGSVAELKEKAINFSDVYPVKSAKGGAASPQFDRVNVEQMDLHKDKVDRIKLKCSKCSKEMVRIPEVIDCWVESSSMPFAEFHYPFENKKVFEARFPGQYIAEYIAQTRAWFYYMHAMSVLLFDDISYENVVCTGTILNEKGEKLSKSKMNYTDPWVIIEQYGVDALRYYLLTSVVLQAENLLFNDREVRDIYNKVVNMLWNVVEFYKMYSHVIPSERSESRNPSKNVLDKWVLARLNQLVGEVTVNMDNYDTVKAGRPIKDFIDELSTWYVRRSRDRFKGDDVADKAAAAATLREVLFTLSKLMAPFTPFIAEKIYLELTGGKELESVHLEMWPSSIVIPAQAGIQSPDDKVLEKMATVRKVVELGLSLRAEAGIKVRQVLGRVVLENSHLVDEYLEIVKDELNVKEMVDDKDSAGKWATKEEGMFNISLDMEVTPELKKEGLAREIIRAINQLRKETGLTVNDKIAVVYEAADVELSGAFEQYSGEIKSAVLAADITAGVGETELTVDGRVLRLKIVKN